MASEEELTGSKSPITRWPRWWTGTLEVYRLVEAHWLLLAADDGAEPVRAEPFEAVELDLAALWG